MVPILNQALIFSTSLKAVKLTNQLKNNVMRLLSLSWFSCNSGENMHKTFRGTKQDLQWKLGILIAFVILPFIALKIKSSRR